MQIDEEIGHSGIGTRVELSSDSGRIIVVYGDSIDGNVINTIPIFMQRTNIKMVHNNGHIVSSNDIVSKYWLDDWS